MINPEVATCIFNQRYMNFKMARKLEPVSSLFRDQAKIFYHDLKSLNMGSIFSSKSKEHLSNSHLEILSQKLAKYCPNLAHVDVNFCIFDKSDFGGLSDRARKPPVQNRYSMNLSNVTSLRSIHVYYPILDVECRFENLTNLEINVSRAGPESVANLASKLAVCQNLQTLKLDFLETDLAEITNLVDVVKSIGSLDTSRTEIHYSSDGDEDLLKLASMPGFCEMLTTLNVHYDSPMRAFDSMTSHFTRLRGVMFMLTSEQNVDAEFFYRSIPTLQDCVVDNVYGTPKHAFDSDIIMKFAR